MEKSQIQQGDVLIMSSDIPANAKKLNHGVLAEGEATGHSHQVADIGLAMLLMDGDDMFLRVTAPEVEITHQEHLPVTVPKGDYKIDIVREYDPFAEEIRRVRD